MRLDFCVSCGKRDAALEHHHFIPIVLGGADDENNMFTVCSAQGSLAPGVRGIGAKSYTCGE
jgi:5-methylcytosine-specific restriction endonuclease McrA